MEGRVRQAVSGLHQQGWGRKEAGVMNTMGAYSSMPSPVDGHSAEKMDRRNGGAELPQRDKQEESLGDEVLSVFQR